MKEQRERYRQAKEELKRVQEDFRSLRERLQVRKKSLLICSLSAEYVKTSWWLSTSKLGTCTEKIVTTNGGIAEK